MKTFRNYRYRLGKLCTVCPNCHMRTFKPYVDAKGAILAPEVGRCNREVKCGYHLRPREWMGSGDVARQLPARATPIPRTDFVPRHIMDVTMRRDVWRLNLFWWFARRFGWQRARKVFSLYFVTYSRSMGGAALFWFVDDKLRVRTGKLMAYDRSAHRRRDLTVAVRFIHQSIRRGFVCRLCFFGIHLASCFPGATLLLCESEKTALYLACALGWRFDEGLYVPVAVGGCSNLKVGLWPPGEPDHRLLPLASRRLLLLPDADSVAPWEASVEKLRLIAGSVSVVNVRKWATAPGDDIMDILERRRSPPA